MSILEHATLVLNRHWQPIHVTTVVRALVMLWNDTAKVIDPVGPDNPADRPAIGPDWRLRG